MLSTYTCHNRTLQLTSLCGTSWNKGQGFYLCMRILRLTQQSTPAVAQCLLLILKLFCVYKLTQFLLIKSSISQSLSLYSFLVQQIAVILQYKSRTAKTKNLHSLLSSSPTPKPFERRLCKFWFCCSGFHVARSLQSAVCAAASCGTIAAAALAHIKSMLA